MIMNVWDITVEQQQKAKCEVKCTEYAIHAHVNKKNCVQPCRLALQGNSITEVMV